MPTYPRWHGERPMAIASFCSTGRAKKARNWSSMRSLTPASMPWPDTSKKPNSRNTASICSAAETAACDS